jgi:hypothetical protein
MRCGWQSRPSRGHDFFRRKDINTKRKQRSLTDHLLWHHSAHSIDIFQYMTGTKVAKVNILQGPRHPKLGIAMDQSIQLKADRGQILTLALSFKIPSYGGPTGCHEVLSAWCGNAI